MNINIWLPLLCIVALAMFNVPIWLALLGGALPYFLILQPTLPVQIAVQRVVAVTETSSYLAIPFFITAGAIMNYAGISSRLLDLADGLVGHLTGGLGHVNILLSVLMGGVSGSAAADASMEAKILVPEMLKRGYDEEFSAAITIASSLITPHHPAGHGPDCVLVCHPDLGGTYVCSGLCARPAVHGVHDDLRVHRLQKARL